DRALRGARSAGRLRRQLQARAAGNRAVREHRDRGPLGDHGASADPPDQLLAHTWARRAVGWSWRAIEPRETVTQASSSGSLPRARRPMTRSMARTSFSIAKGLRM